MRRIAVLLFGTAFFWGLTAGLGYLALEEQRDVILGYSLTSLVLCLIPAIGTMLWVEWSAIQAPEQQLATVLGGTGVRMFFVLGVGWILSSNVAFYQQQSFWIWLLVYYLFILGLEMYLLVGRKGMKRSEKLTP